MADRPTERRRLDHMTDDDLDALYADLDRARRVAVALENDNRRLEDEAAIDKQVMEKADRDWDEAIDTGRAFRQWAEHCHGYATRFWLAWKSARRRAEAYREGILRLCEDRDSWKGWMWEQAARAERAEQQLAAVRALHARDDSNPRGPWCGTCMTAWPCATIAALDGAQQPECPGCGDTGACAGGPCAHPDATWESHEASADSHDGAQQPDTAREGSDRPWNIDDSIRSWNEYDDQRDRHKNGEPDGIAQPARQDGHTGACGAQTAPGDPEPAEHANGPQTGAQDREEGQS